MVLSNVWGLFLIILLLGYGLVSVPRRLWNDGNLEQRVRYYQYEASNLEEGLIESKFQLNETVKVIYAAMHRNVQNPALQAKLGMIAEKVPKDILEHHQLMRSYQSLVAEENLGQVTEDRLVQLHRDLKSHLSEYNRAQW